MCIKTRSEAKSGTAGWDLDLFGTNFMEIFAAASH